MDDEMGCECGTYADKKNTYEDSVKNHERKMPLYGHRRRWEANIKIIFRNGAWTRLNWLRIGESDGMLWTRKWSCVLHQTLRISRLLKELIYPQENSPENSYKCSVGVFSALSWLGRLYVIEVIRFKVPYKYGSSPTVFWLGAGTIYLNCSKYMRLMMLGRQKYIQQDHSCLSRVTLMLRWLL